MGATLFFLIAILTFAIITLVVLVGWYSVPLLLSALAMSIVICRSMKRYMMNRIAKR